MQATSPLVGNYGVLTSSLLSSFEDECVGRPPDFIEGVVVSRVEGEKIYVRDWCINSHFTGEQALEKFEEAKNNQDFDFTFSSEREIKKSDTFNGADPVLQKQLRRQLK